jgi:type I restriction enzyme S subunit
MKKVKVKNIAKVITGKTPPKKDPENFGDKYLFIKIPDLKDQKYVKESGDKLSEKGAELIRSLAVPKHAVMISCLATVGEVGLSVTDSFTNQQINSLICNKNKVNPEYLYYYFLKDKENLKQLGGGGSVYTNISKNKLENYHVELPDLETQTKIADILSAFDEKIELNNKINDNLEELAQAIFKHWFVDFEFPNEEGKPYKSSGGKMVDSEMGKIPEGWEVEGISGIADINYGKGLPKKDQKEEGFPVYGANGIMGYYDEYNFKEPKIIVGCRGVVGNVSLTLPNSFVTNNSLIIDPKKADLKEYLLKYLQYQNLQSVVSGSAQPQITITNMKTLKIIIPNERLVKKFSLAIKRINRLINEKYFENKKLSSMRDLLLPKLINGKIKP